jgi:NAD(P)-dependent dehydrogenase (short-subunit alcohol dehydrogenase family)
MGMGLELTLLLVKAGCSVAMADIQEAALQEAQAVCEVAKLSAEVKISTHVVDMGDRAAIGRLQAEVVAAHGETVHLLFNNAGIQIGAAWDTMSEATHDKVMAVNLDGVVTATRVFWPNLMNADEVGHSGLVTPWCWGITWCQFSSGHMRCGLFAVFHLRFGAVHCCGLHE